MQNKTIKPEIGIVKNFFNSPDSYLRNNTTIPARVELIKGMLAGKNYNDCLELGCGDGSISLSLNERVNTLTLVDISPRMIEIARKKTLEKYQKKVQYHIGDATTYSARKQFELILCIGVLAHVNSVDALVENISRLSLPGGWLLIQISDSETLWGSIINLNLRIGKKLKYSTNQMTESSVKQLFVACGFKAQKTVTYSDAGFGLGMIHKSLATRFKVLSGKLSLGGIFSEKLILFKNRAKKES